MTSKISLLNWHQTLYVNFIHTMCDLSARFQADFLLFTFLLQNNTIVHEIKHNINADFIFEKEADVHNS